MADPIVNMNIAELVVTAEPIVICTVLGSCVSVCLFTDEGTAGGMIHYALPQALPNNTDTPLRYGDKAIASLVEEMQNLTGLAPTHFKAKIIGGADSIESANEAQRIGQANIQIAKRLLAEYEIPIVGEDIGGKRGRKVLFHVKTGRLQSAFVGPGFSRPSASRAIQQKITTAVNETTPVTLAPKKVFIIDDSKTIRDLLCRIIQKDPELKVIGQAEDPLQAEAMLKNLKPDVITLDIHMPNMTGPAWLKAWLPQNPVPVVLITSLELKEGNEVFDALEAGAVDYIQKPNTKDMAQTLSLILEKIKIASGAKVKTNKQGRSLPRPRAAPTVFPKDLVFAIGASTGGTQALTEVLLGLPKEIPAVVIVQHIPALFSRAFADRLHELCPFDVKEAEDGDAVHAGRVLIAPGGSQMKIVRKSSGLFVEVNDDLPMNRHKPSVDYLFQSVAQICGKNAVGAILTGMGADGARGLLQMRTSGAKTLSQDEASCVVYGMPKSAWDLGGSEQQVALDKVAAKLVQLAKEK